MAQKLKMSKIKSVDLVGEGSCGDAHITLFKGKDGDHMGFNEFFNSLTTAEQQIVTAEINKAKAQLPEGAMSAEDSKKLADEKAAAEAAKKQAEDNLLSKQKELDDAKKAAPVAKSKTDEEILKDANLDPAVKEILERAIAKSKAAEEQVLKAKQKEEEAAFIAKAKEVPFVPEANTKLVDLFKSINGVEGAVDAVMDILKSVNTVVSNGAAFKEIGNNGNAGTVGDTADAAWAKIEKAADEYVAKGQSVSKSKAIDMVIAEQPKLYDAYVNALRNNQ